MAELVQLDLGLKGLLFCDSRESLCLVLEQDTLSLLSTGPTQDDITEKLLAWT